MYGAPTLREKIGLLLQTQLSHQVYCAHLVYCLRFELSLK